MDQKLGQFEDRDVISTSIAVRNTGDGLSEAMKTDPQMLHHGDTVYVVMECEVEKVRHDPIKDTEALTRVHMLKAGTATIVDADLVGDAVEAQAEKNRRRQEDEAGVKRLPYEQELRSQHTLGEHASGLVEGCSMCQEEAEAEKDEAAARQEK